MASLVASGLYSCMLASRILGNGALQGGMPIWKYIANRFLTLFENFLLGAKLSEYHTGYRAFSRTLLEKLRIEENSDDFVFDNEMLAEILWLDSPIGEVTCPTRYMPEASSINFRRSVRYGFGCLRTGLQYRWAKNPWQWPVVRQKPRRREQDKPVRARSPPRWFAEEPSFSSSLWLAGLCLLPSGLSYSETFCLVRQFSSTGISGVTRSTVTLILSVSQITFETTVFPPWSFHVGMGQDLSYATGFLIWQPVSWFPSNGLLAP